MKIYIYIIYFPISNRLNPYYVGQTAYLEKRMFSHLGNKSLVGNALRKYDDWVVEVLHTTKDRDTANLLEIEEIRNFDCVAPNGYNLTRGGDGNDQTGMKHTEETKEKMRIAHQGKHPTEETKKKMKRVHKGQHKGNQFAKGHGAPKGYKHTKEWKQENGERMQGNQYAKGKNLGRNNGSYKTGKHTKEAKRTKLLNRIANLEKDIDNDSN